MVDDEYPDRVLLAEANQWPADVVEYFGDPTSGGDECHMAFHFPLMPRIFMAVRRESRYPISEILAQTPAIPADCQWGIFLRNHDELTLEMVTDEERDYMYAEYAKDPRMRANIGIRRRLAPLLDNDRNQIELFTALLLSLPGSPVLYYGDEIGMGDNIWLGDRDGVRTPMQWTPDRNAGFSTRDPGRLYLPTDHGPGLRLPGRSTSRPSCAHTSSLLHWTRRMLAVRKRHRAFGARRLPASWAATNPSVLAYRCATRRRRRRALRQQPLAVRPAGRAGPAHTTGYRPVELIGGVRFPSLGTCRYLLTLPGHGFYWFTLRPTEEGRDDYPTHTPVNAAHLAAWLPEQRWFRAKGHAVREVRPVDSACR